MKRSTVFLSQSLLLSAAKLTLAADAGEDSLTLQKSESQQITNISDTLHDIHGPLPTTEYPPYLVETILVLLLLALLALLFFFLKRRKKPLPPPVPPWDAALMELHGARRLMSGDQSLFYMEQVAQILRRYIELRFAMRSTRQTTHEFFASLPNSGHASLLEYRAELQTCLEQADLAKFAHLIADVNHMEQMENAVRTFITSTRPEETASGGRS